ncbi:7197_t:CDS:2, partial [Funneliformis geosporum]
IATHAKWSYPLIIRDSTNGGVEFQGDVIRLINKYGVNIRIANSKKSIGIVERFNKTLQEWSSIIQDAVDMRLPISE